MARQVLDEVAIRAHPLFDVVSRTGGKSVSAQDARSLWLMSPSVTTPQLPDADALS